MLFVPVVPPISGAASPSPRARELAGLLHQVVEEYSAAHPSVKPEEIRQAVRMTQMSVQDGSRRAAALVMGGLSIMVALGVAGLFVFRSGSLQAEGGVGSVAVLGIMVVIAVVMVVLKLLSR